MPVLCNRIIEVARRSRATKRGSVLRTAPREVGEQGIEP